MGLPRRFRRAGRDQPAGSLDRAGRADEQDEVSGAASSRRRGRRLRRRAPGARDEQYLVRHRLSPRQVQMVLAGGQIPLLARTADTQPGS